MNPIYGELNVHFSRCVKFVSCTNGSFSKKKIRGHSFIRKNTKPGEGPPGGGVEEGLANHHTFYLIFFVKPSLITIDWHLDISTNKISKEILTLPTPGPPAPRRLHWLGLQGLALTLPGSVTSMINEASISYLHRHPHPYLYLDNCSL